MAISISIFILGAALRVAAFLSPRSFWGDEWSAIEYIRLPFWECLRTTVLDTHPPLYYALGHFSYHFLGNNDLAYRLPSLAAGILTPIAVYLAAQELFDKKTARLALFFAAI